MILWNFLIWNTSLCIFLGYSHAKSCQVGPYSTNSKHLALAVILWISSDTLLAQTWNILFLYSRCCCNLIHHSSSSEIRTQISINKQNLAGLSYAIPHKNLLLSHQYLNHCKDEICSNFHAKAQTKSHCFVTTVCLKKQNTRSMQATQWDTHRHAPH